MRLEKKAGPYGLAAVLSARFQNNYFQRLLAGFFQSTPALSKSLKMKGWKSAIIGFLLS
jgi:hypothetical protein